MKRKNITKHEVFKLEGGYTLLLEKEYDSTGQVLLYASLKAIDYDSVRTLASGESGEDFIVEIDSYINLLQSLRKELLSVEKNPS